jgi:hypothetical protein
MAAGLGPQAGPARLWFAREASARDGALAAPASRGFPTSAIRCFRASEARRWTGESERQAPSALTLQSVAKSKSAPPRAHALRVLAGARRVS